MQSSEWLDNLTDEEVEELEHRLRWVGREARVEQLTPLGDWFVWLVLAGRGWGKTRTAAEDVAAYGLDYPESRIAVVAETFADGRDVCIEGESGILSCLPNSSIRMWNRSMGELHLHNGSAYRLYSGDKPEKLRGPQHHRAWVDELAKFRYDRETWTQLMLGLRLGANPQVIVTTTPRPIKLLKELYKRDSTFVTTGSTFDNAPNLAAPFLEEIMEQYQGTRVGRQELYAEILEDHPGALFTRGMIQHAVLELGDDRKPRARAMRHRRM